MAEKSDSGKTGQMMSWLPLIVIVVWIGSPAADLTADTTTYVPSVRRVIPAAGGAELLQPPNPVTRFAAA